MKKIIRKYRLEDIGKQEEEEIKYWSPISTSEKTEMVYSLWQEFCWIQGVNVDAQRLRRVIKITKLSQG